MKFTTEAQRTESSTEKEWGGKAGKLESRKIRMRVTAETQRTERKKGEDI